MENKQRPNGTGSTEGESALNTLEKEGCAIRKVKNSINMRSSVDFHFQYLGKRKKGTIAKN